LSWPSERVVAAAFRGIAEVIRTPLGNLRGISSADPKIYVVFQGREPLACCERCNKAEAAPPTPAGAAAPGAPPTALVAPGTKAHALHVLTWLHGFTKRHWHGK
jgi:hypothetical protein